MNNYADSWQPLKIVAFSRQIDYKLQVLVKKYSDNRIVKTVDINDVLVFENDDKEKTRFFIDTVKK